MNVLVDVCVVPMGVAPDASRSCHLPALLFPGAPASPEIGQTFPAYFKWLVFRYHDNKQAITCVPKHGQTALRKFGAGCFPSG